MAIEETASADDKMTARQWLSLLGVTCSAFVLNTSEFMPIGLLTDIAGSLVSVVAVCALRLDARGAVIANITYGESLLILASKCVV